MVPLPVPEPSLPVVDQSCPPRTVTPPPLNILVPIMEECQEHGIF